MSSKMVDWQRIPILKNDPDACLLTELYDTRHGNTNPFQFFSAELEFEVKYRCTMLKFNDITYDTLTFHLNRWLDSIPEFSKKIVFFLGFLMECIESVVNSSEVNGSFIDFLKYLKENSCSSFFQNAEYTYMMNILFYRRFCKTPDSSVGMARLSFLKILF
jgi:hypothetical protein